MMVGALCAGYGGLELGLGLVDPPVFVAETNPDAARVLQHRFGSPNLGDITTITEDDIHDHPPVDIITAGFPCQPVSQAGLQKGIHDERWLIEDVCRVAQITGASILVLENVRRILTANGGAAMQHVCEAMASAGFERWEWTTLRASDVGAPHRRDRWFCVAYANNFGREWAREAWGRGTGPTHGGHHQAAAHPNGERLQERRLSEAAERWIPAHPARCSRFGPYAAAVQQWELIHGAPVPEPLVDGKLDPRFVEWMMGLPAGWVTDIIESRRAALRVLGNGVVPLQVRTALHQLTKET